MKKYLRVAVAIALGGGMLVACGDEAPACAATAPPRPFYKPAPRTTKSTNGYSRPQDKTKAQPTKRVTSWTSNTRQRNWTKSYRQGYPPAPQPIIINQYRTYPGYPGFYPPGIWPFGYGERYGCMADQEGQPTG